jgi:natural product biosynthesis luciferase-like monooxygenase protein/amino acid adenylation domain-containing protein
MSDIAVESFRLSIQQKHLWLLQQLDHSLWYRTECLVLITGSLDTAALRDAIEQLSERHEILRTTFQPVPGMILPVQVINTPTTSPLSAYDLSGWTGAVQTEQLSALTRELREQPSDLANGPLLRLALVTLTPTTHHLLLSCPALIADTPTLTLLVRDLSQLYAAIQQQTLCDETSVQYADVSEWQHELLESQETESERAYWRKVDLKLLDPLPLPFTAPSIDSQRFMPAAIPLSLVEYLPLLTQRAQQYQTTPAVILLACWQTLLWRLSGQDDLIVGVAYDGRSYEQLANAVGLFAKYLPLAAHFDPQLPFEAFLARVQTSFKEYYEWQEYFSWDQLEHGRPAGVEPFCPYGFDIIALPPTFPAADICFTLADADACIDRFLLKLSLTQHPEQLGLQLHYDAARFQAADMARLGDYLMTLLASALAAPGMLLSRLELLPDTERTYLLAACNQTDQPSPDQCFHQLVAAQAARSPDAVAVVCGTEQLTYAALHAAAARLAQQLRALGVGPDVPVALLLDRAPDLLVALLGVLQAGGAFVPLDPTAPPARLAFLLADTRAPVLLTQTRHRAQLPDSSASVLYLDAPIAVPTALPPRAAPVQPTNLAYLIYTSGSTGQPKAVMVTHQGLVNYLSWCVRTYPIAAGAGTLVHSPLNFDLTITGLLAPLLVGQRVVLLPEGATIDALSSALRDGTDYSLVKLTPAHLDLLRQLLPATAAADRAQALVIGGEALNGEQVSFWRTNAPRTRLINEYGPTETVVGCCVYELPEGPAPAGPLPIGRPIANTQLYVLNQHGAPQPTGVVGELYIGGLGVARGYLNQPALTAERFVPNPFARPDDAGRRTNDATNDATDAPPAGGGAAAGGRLYRTGDLARYRADGVLEFLGRDDAQVKLRGFRIELGEIAALLRQHAAVHEALVVLKSRTPAESAQLIAYVLPAQGAADPMVAPPLADTRALIAELRAYLAAQLPEYMLPQALVLLERWPLTTNGKIDRAALPMPERHYTPPTRPAEEVLAGVWAQVLGVATVGVEENYFALGGDSIRSIQVVAQAQERGLTLTIDQLFQHPTIRGLVDALVDAQAAAQAQAQPPLEAFGLIEADDRAQLPAAIADAYPVARLQGGMIFHNQQSPEASVYHDIFSYHLKLPINVAMLRTAVEQLVQRHPVLRTTFDLTSYSTPLQLVHRSGAQVLHVTDLRHLDPEAQETIVRAWIDQEKQRGFDITQLPLFRFQVHLRSEQTIQFAFSFHHAIIDGWSDVSMLTELFTHYFALLQGTPLEIAAPATHYRDFVLLERAAIESAEAQQFWDAMLHDRQMLELPRRRKATAPDAPGVVIVPVPVDAALSNGLKQLALAAAVPVKNVLLAAHLRVLSLLSGQRDVLTCMVASGRPETRDGERVLGLFINSLPLRVRLAGGSWRDLAADVFAAEQAVMPYRRYPLAELTRRYGGRLSETLFYFTHYHILQSLRGFAELELLELIAHEVSSFPLVANFWIDPFTSQVNLSLTCDGTQFDREQVQSIAGYYARVLTLMATAPETRYETAALLGAAEQQQLLWDWNATALEVPAGGGLHDLIDAQVARTPEAIALVVGERQFSYRALQQHAEQLAQTLRQCGVGPEVRVGIYLERSAELLIAMLGVLKAGGAYLPLDPAYPPDRLSFILADSAAAVLLTQRRLAAHLPQHSAEVIYLDGDWRPRTQTHAAPARCLASDNLAYVIYTSGSTGTPKGVMISHANVINFFAAMDRRIESEPLSTWLAVTSVSFDISALELLWTLNRGLRVVLQGEPEGFLYAAEQSVKATNKEIAFSLFYFASDEDEATEDKYRLLIEGAKFADKHGFAAVWTPERHFHAFGGLYPNPAVTSAAIATVTEHIQIRAGSVVLPIHHPLRVAEEWSVVDNISRGRVGLSFASGWHEHDFVFAPEQYTDRKRIMLRDIEIVRSLWRGETVAFPGVAGKTVEMQIHPRPIQPELPIWVTAAGNPETFALAGRVGANLLTHLLGQNIEELAEKISIYRDAWRAAGHGPGTGQVTLMLHTFVGDDVDVVREKVRKPFCNYLKSSVDLVKDLARSAGFDGNAQQLSEDDLDALLNYAFDRYFETSGLLGTPSICLSMIDRLRAIDVDEVACLIDFGVDFDSVMTSLGYLNEVRQHSNAYGPARDNDYAIPAQILRQRVSHLQCTPSIAQLLMIEPAALQALGKVDTLLLGGEALPTALAHPLRAALSGTILNMYGPTETTIWSTTQDIADGDEPISIGRPIANTAIYILDGQLQPVPVGVPADLYIGGAGVARGYLNNPALTAERFIPNPFATTTDDSDSDPCVHCPSSFVRLYATGDLARYLPDGRLEFLGRTDHQVKIRGYRIELGEIEAVLRAHPAVQESIVMARADLAGERRLVAYIVPQPEETPTSSELHHALQAKLPAYMVPSDFVLLERIPLMPSGKIDRQALPAPEGSRPMLADRFVAPRTPLQEVVAGLWADVLGLEQVGIHDSFFELGGYSLQATQLVSRLRKAFQIDLPLRSLFEVPTIAGLAEKIEIAQRTEQQLHVPPLQPIGHEGELPLSFAQQGLWFLDQRAPDHSAYNEPAAVRLSGPLDLALLEQSVNTIVCRHEALRLSIQIVNQRPVQVVAPALRVPLPLIDLRSVPATQQAAEVRQLATAAIQERFALDRVPLLRTILFRLDEQEHILLLIIHHIVSDGWSMGIFIQEMATLYSAFSTGQPSPLPDLPIQYVDFAAWQRQWLQGDALESLLAYWRRALGDDLPILRLPTDWPRPAVQTFRGATYFFTLPQDLSAALKTLSRDNACTLFMTLLAGFQALLHHYSGQDDIVVGTDTANRNQSEIEGLIGLFVNQLVLRTDLSGTPTFRELLGRVRQVTLGAYAHQDLPFDRLVEALNPARDVSRTPLFQVKLVLQNATLPDLKLPELTISPIEVERGAAKFDLLLNIGDAADGLIGWLEYNTDLFGDAMIARMVRHFEAILQHVVAQPDSRLNTLAAMLAEQDQQEQIAQEQALQQASLQKFKHARRKATRIAIETEKTE